jgi:hypothetical protein
VREKMEVKREGAPSMRVWKAALLSSLGVEEPQYELKGGGGERLRKKQK